MNDLTGDLKTIHVVGAAILEGNKCLVALRGPGLNLAGKWEFPGGKPEDGETPEAALANLDWADADVPIVRLVQDLMRSA